jgi:predicted membrane protein
LSVEFETFVSFDSYLYIMRVSYIYSAFMGFWITLILGLFFTYILKLLKKQGPELIYTDASKTVVNADLFMPPKAKSIRKRNAMYEVEKKKNEVLYRF